MTYEEFTKTVKYRYELCNNSVFIKGLPNKEYLSKNCCTLGDYRDCYSGCDNTKEHINKRFFMLEEESLSKFFSRVLMELK